MKELLKAYYLYFINYILVTRFSHGIGQSVSQTVYDNNIVVKIINTTAEQSQESSRREYRASVL